MLSQSSGRIRGAIAALALLFAMFVLAGCGQSSTVNTDVNETEDDSAAAVLQAYRESGDQIIELSATNPATSIDVTNLVGTVPAYDLTQGNPPCAGFMQAIPSLVFTLPEGVATVDVAFKGDAPSTLVLVAEGEAILCDKDAPGLTPEMSVSDPVAGRYGVWIGRADMRTPVNGKLTVSVAK
ncbi:MAG: hypothetical protein IPK16_14645 [Anaerolineales bacterium]|nr:hypothetical protein [Anaerolineales bacterium]